MSNIQNLLSGKEKLEFGNQEQIKAIDDFTEAQKEAEEDKQCYIVEYAASGTLVMEIYAQDEDEAREKAEDEKYDCEDEVDLDFDFLDIRLKEKE